MIRGLLSALTVLVLALTFAAGWHSHDRFGNNDRRIEFCCAGDGIPSGASCGPEVCIVDPDQQEREEEMDGDFVVIPPRGGGQAMCVRNWFIVPCESAGLR